MAHVEFNESAAGAKKIGTAIWDGVLLQLHGEFREFL